MSDIFNVSHFVCDENSIPEIIRDLLIGMYWEALANVRNNLSGRIRSHESPNAVVADNATIRGDVFIGDGSKIGENTVIEGPVYIGANCEISTGVLIRPNTVIGEGCHIGHGSEIKASVMCSGSKVASLAFVGDSILGKGARVGSGTITANRGFDQDSIVVKADGVSIDSGFGFLGCILGDNSRLGANATTQPGTAISPYCWAYPGTALRGYIPEAKRIYNPKPMQFEDNRKVDLS